MRVLGCSGADDRLLLTSSSVDEVCSRSTDPLLATTRLGWLLSVWCFLFLIQYLLLVVFPANIILVRAASVQYRWTQQVHNIYYISIVLTVVCIVINCVGQLEALWFNCLKQLQQLILELNWIFWCSKCILLFFVLFLYSVFWSKLFFNELSIGMWEFIFNNNKSKHLK